MHCDSLPAGLSNCRAIKIQIPEGANYRNPTPKPAPNQKPQHGL